MSIVKASKTGNTISLAVPAVLRKEIGVNTADYFHCVAPNTNQILYTRVASDAISDRIDNVQNKVKHAKPKRVSAKSKHRTHRSKH